MLLLFTQACTQPFFLHLSVHIMIELHLLLTAGVYVSHPPATLQQDGQDDGEILEYISWTFPVF